MKKLFILGIVGILVVSLIIAIPAMANNGKGKGSGQPDNCRAVFECDIVSVDVEEATLDKGEAYVRENGNYKVEVEGVVLDDAEIEALDVYLVDLMTYDFYYLGTITLDEDGEGKVEGSLMVDADPILEDTTVVLPLIGLGEEGCDPMYDPLLLASGFYVPPAP